MKVLLMAYACAPDRGSEPGLGWGWATTLAGLGHDVCVVTRASSRPAIEAALTARPQPRLTVVYHDLPPWARRLKARFGGLATRAYYLAWMRSVTPRLRELAATGRFDVAHHVTFAQYWSGTALDSLDLPLLWGPVGGGEPCEAAFWPGLGWRGATYEALRRLLPRLAEHRPALRRLAGRCRLAVATTPETAERMRAIGAASVMLQSQVALAPETLNQLASSSAGDGGTSVAGTGLRLVALGPLLPHKGLHLALAALAKVAGDWHLEVIGDGPQRARLARLADDLGIGARVTFVGRLPQAEAHRRLARSHALIFPALHDSGGFAVAEAMAAGLAIVCLRRGGPAQLVPDEAGIKVAAATPDEAVAGLASAITSLVADPPRCAALGRVGRSHAVRNFLWPTRATALYDRFLKAPQ
ncbi:MAG: glycosyltransferase family 4 protein [Alphaproteobacteria bacterium]|jgi:glycosyltransferase involved in cell wall biosynthesis|nr:glycosyltransferase family 4 protein [Alphaproteobacteria bacterium]